MAAPLVFLLTYGTLVAVRGGAPGDCPTGLQLEEALRARLPGAVASRTVAGSPDVLELELVSGPTPGAYVLRLRGDRGAVELERALAHTAPPSSAGADCGALAETVAIIVDRYLEELAVKDARAAALPPTPPPSSQRSTRWPRTRLRLMAGPAFVTPDHGVGGVRLGGAAGPLLGDGRLRGYLLGRAAVAAPTEVAAVPRPRAMRRAELGLEAGALLGKAAWSVELGVAGGLERTSVDGGQPAATWSPWVGPRAALAWALGARTALRATMGLDALLVRVNVQSEQDAVPRLYQAPWVRVHLGLELSAVFF